MIETMNQLAVSLAGHDKEHIYAIVREEGDLVCLADGKTKTLERLQRKQIPPDKGADHNRICPFG